jgi:hypothetical protein
MVGYLRLILELLFCIIKSSGKSFLLAMLPGKSPMKTLSRDAFLKAKLFVKTHARPINRALFAYYFEGGPQAAQEWAGHLTVQPLKVLHNFKRIERI